MSGVNQDLFDKRMEQIAQVASLVKLIGGLLFVCVCGVGYGFIWINQTTTAIAQSQKRIDVSEAATNERIKDWGAWRSETDKTQARLASVQESQQRLMERLADKVYAR